MMRRKKKKIAIIGAGLAGLNCANMLSAVADVTVFEKSNKVGGRMATHFDRDDDGNEYAFDHGAQYFTVKHPVFRAFMQDLIEQQVVARWDARFVEFDLASTNPQVKSQRVWSDEFPHYVGTPSMRSVSEYLSRPLDVKLNHRVTSVNQVQGKWQCSIVNEGIAEDFDWVIITTPAPQADKLIALNRYFDLYVPDIEMKPCFALMLGYREPKLFSWDAALITNAAISWISVNSTKPERLGLTSIVAMSDNDWARENFHENDVNITTQMLGTLNKITGQTMHDAEFIQLKRWRFANATRVEPPLDLINEKVGLACCGDWCKVGRVESAFMSAYNTALSIKKAIA